MSWHHLTIMILLIIVAYPVLNLNRKGVEWIMISTNTRAFLDTPISDFIIPSEKVAHVQVGNSAEHALFVLLKQVILSSGIRCEISFSWFVKYKNDYRIYFRFRTD